MTIEGLKSYLVDPKRLFGFASGRGLLNWMSDECFVKIQYRLITGKKLSLQAPTELNEKMQYLKLHDRRPEYTAMADKYAVKDIISGKLGPEYVVPLIGVWDRVEDIDFDALPDKFVLKCTHDSSGHVICRDKSALNITKTRKKLAKRLNRNYYWSNREWPYKNVKPRIIAEKLLEPADGKAPDDYKFFFFGGELQYFTLMRGGAGHHARNNKFDRNLNSIVDRFGEDEKQRLWLSEITFPDNMDEMIAVAEKLGQGFRHIRIDLYNIDGHIYFGEYTFFNKGGYFYYPKETADRLAEKIDLAGL